jgi:hypothetical protein
MVLACILVVLWCCRPLRLVDIYVVVFCAFSLCLLGVVGWRGCEGVDQMCDVYCCGLSKHRSRLCWMSFALVALVTVGRLSVCPYQVSLCLIITDSGACAWMMMMRSRQNRT